MDEQNLPERFAANCAALRALYFQDNSIFPRLGGFLLTVSGQSCSQDALLAGKKLAVLLDDRFDRLSRQLAPLLTAAGACAPDPELFFLRSADAYHSLRSTFRPSPQLIPTACMLALCAPNGNLECAVGQAKALYDALARAYPITVGYADLGPCALYALQQQDVRITQRRLQICAKQLKPDGRVSSSQQALAHILCLRPDTQPACDRALALSNALSRRSLRFGKAGLQSGLGVLSVLDAPVEETAAQVELCTHQLKRQPGFGAFSICAKERLLWGSLLTALRQQRQHPTPNTQQALLSACVYLAGSSAEDSLEGLCRYRKS